MIKMTIIVKTHPFKEMEFTQSMESLIKEFRKDRGCLHYHFTREKAGEFRLSSEWETMDELKNHFQCQLFNVFLGAFHTLCDSPEIKITDGESSFGMELIETLRGD